MKMLASLAVAAGVAIAIPTPGLVSAQVTTTRVTRVEVTKAEAPKPEVTPEVAKFLREWLPRLAPPPAGAQAKAAVERPLPPAGQLNAFAVLPQANVEAMTRQMTQQLRPVLAAELRLLTSAAGPSAAQRRAIALDAGRATREAARQTAAFQVEINQNGRVLGKIPDPRKMIREAMAAAALVHLSPVQVALYQAELDGRVHFQHQVVALNLVASLDRLLMLAPGQREKLVESFLADWDDRVFPSFETLANYEGYFPNIPDPSVVPHLDERQRVAWRDLRKVSFGQSFNFNNGPIANEQEDDEDVKAALAEEPKS